MSCCHDEPIWLEPHGCDSTVGRDLTNLRSLLHIEHAPWLLLRPNHAVVTHLRHELNGRNTADSFTLVNSTFIFKTPSLNLVFIGNNGLLSAWNELYNMDIFRHAITLDLFLHFGIEIIKTKRWLGLVNWYSSDEFVIRVNIKAFDAWYLFQRVDCFVASKRGELVLLWVWVWSFQVLSHGLRLLTQALQLFLQFLWNLIWDIWLLWSVNLYSLSLFKKIFVRRELILGQFQDILDLFLFFDESCYNSTSCIMLVERMGQLFSGFI